MWAMTPFGILMPAIRPPKTVKPGDSRTLQIRARRAKDLDILRASYMRGSLGPNIFTPEMDYEVRAYCEPAAFGLALAQMVMEIDYLKFKPTTESKFADAELHACYNGIWGVVMAKLSSKTHQESYWSKYAPLVNKGDDLDLDLSAVEDYKDSGRFGTGYGWPEDRAWDLPFREGDSDEGLSPEIAALLAADYAEEQAELIAQLSEELDDLTNSEPAEITDHSECGHAESDTALSRCRQRQLREHAKRVEEIRQLVEESIAETKTAPSSSAAE